MPRKTEFISYKTRTILNKHKRPDHWFWTHYTAYPYIGCQHGCEFCYCREKKYAPYEAIEDFPYVIKVKENAPILLRKALNKVSKGMIAVGDYQPAEKKFKISRKMLEVCLELDFPVFILERSPLVLRDLDLIRKIIDLFIGSIFLFPAVAEFTPVLASDVGIRCITRPKPVIGALVLIEDRTRFVWYELGFSGHIVYLENVYFISSGR